ncbi:N-alpha-acetyltransferase, non-catalitic subunit [Coemansia sp. S142-1]|nr:N-alpha-acetyltransferase, non-catalitic subunit [Coemansia sp. S142-1]
MADEADAELAQLAAHKLDMEECDDWLDITSLVKTGAQTLASGELIKPESLTLLDAMTSIQVMDSRLDMGMLSDSDMAEIAQWDIDRTLSLTDTLWIVDRMLCCEMTWHNSASLLQTIYTCNYYITDDLPPAIGQAEVTSNKERDLVLYPLLVATGLCCRQVWHEYSRENVYAEEDVLLGLAVLRFFEDQYSLADTMRLLDVAQAYLETRLGEEEAAAMLLAHVSMRKRWLAALVCLSVEYLSEDPSALDRSMTELEALAAEHQAYRSTYAEHIGQAVDNIVPGVFDAKCMRKFPSLAPIKPKELLKLSEAHATLARLVSGLSLVRKLLRIESVESLVHFFQGVSRQAEPLPYLRSLLISVFASDGHVQLTQPLLEFVRRSIRELCGTKLMGEEGDRIDLFYQEAARMLVDWFRTLCQNAPRQRRIALKYLAGWDSLQGEAEQLDIWLYTQRQPNAPSTEASDPAFNPFWISSWAYHMKLVLMGGALMTGIRLDVYLAYEFPQIFCYVTQVFESHASHLTRMLEMSGSNELNEEKHRLWTRQGVSDIESKAQLERWLSVAVVQKELATALWLVSHACERLGVFRPPWAKGRSKLALEVCRTQESEVSQNSRYALRFRAFSRLNSPTPLTFDGWMTTKRQLDEYPISDLFVHAARILTDAKTGLDKCRRGFEHTGEEFIRAMYYVVLANSVALAKLLKSDAVKSRAMAVFGADAVVFRETLLNEALAQTDSTSSDMTKAKAKREKKKRAARNEAAARAHEWQADVDQLVSSGALNVSWTTAADRHPDWPVFTF